jgi:4-hydroxy-tetrahydrodipicolinate synthase
MPTGLHPIYVAIYRRYHAGDRDGAVTLFRRLLPILAFSNQHLDISVHFFKRLLYRQGIYPTARVRPPILPFDLVHECLADALITEAIDWMKELDHA